jgi:hypothetical protein
MVHDRIAIDPKVMLGKPLIRGTRKQMTRRFWLAQRKSRGLS